MFRFGACCLGLVLASFTTVGWLPAQDNADRYQVLTSGRDTNPRSIIVSNPDFSPNRIDWKVGQRHLTGGKQDGVTLIDIDNGSLTITVVPTRGMSILEVVDNASGNRIFGWDSPVKEVVNPQYINLDSRGGLGWLEGFNEWMVRCGLEYAGQAGKDQFVTNTGDVAEMNLNLHGKIANIPASMVEVFVEKVAPHRIRVRGVVYEQLFFGPKLRLTTELSTVPGTREFRLNDEVTNQAGSEQEFELIYHINFGRPILEQGASLVLAVSEIAPMNVMAERNIGHYLNYAGPTPEFIENVYLMKPYADANGFTAALLQNSQKNLGAVVRWQTDRLPYLTIWKNTASEADGYVTGIEPANCYPNNRRVERAAGRLQKLPAGETQKFVLEFQALDNPDSIAAATAAIQQIRSDRPTNIIPLATDQAK